MQTRRDIDRRIHELAARTCSIVHARDLRAAGIGRDAIACRVGNGTMARLAPRTYAVGPTCFDPTRAMLAMSGVLSAGDGAAIDGETAGELLGVWDRAGTTVHVAVPRRGKRNAPMNTDQFRFHRVVTRWNQRSGGLVGPIPVVGFVEMCFRMARTLTVWQLAFVMQRGIYERFVTSAELAAAAHRNSHWPWVTTFRTAVELVSSA